MDSTVISEKRVFKRWASVVVACIVSFLFISVTVALGGAAAEGPGDDIEGHFLAALLSLVSAALVWLVLSMGVFTGVEVRPGEVVVRNFLRVVRIPSGSISKVTWRGGLRIHVGSEKSYLCTAFPDSLYSLVLGYRNFKRVSEGIERALAEYPESAMPGPIMERTELRGRLFWGLMVGLFLGYLLAFALVRFW